MGNLSNFVSQFGIELEIQVLNENDASRIIRNSLSEFSITHDASIQSDIFLCNGLKLLQKPPSYLGYEPYTAGAEIISIPLEFNDNSRELIKRLTYILETKGEPAESYRESLHIHIDCTYNLDILKNFVHLGRFLEDVLYYIGGQGYTHRGMKVNEFLYCRPITGNGPTIIDSNFGNVQVFTCDDLLKATTVTRFFNRLGGACNSSTSHMHPARYFYLNMYSLLAHHTLEFRVFNKTLNPEFIWAEVQFCRSFVKYAIRKSLDDILLVDLPTNSIFDRRDKGSILNTLYEFSDQAKIKPDIVNVLSNIINQTPEIIVPDRLLRTHVSYHPIYDDSEYKPVKVSPYDINSVTVDDIHSRRGERS